MSLLKKHINKYQAQGRVGASHGRRNAPPPPEPKATFWDHAIDVGEFALNTLATPFETITGTNFYDPEFESDFMQDTSDITSAITSTGTDIAGNMVAGPLYSSGKAGLTKTAQGMGLKDATHSGHNAWAEKTADTIGFLGDASQIMAGGVPGAGGGSMMERGGTPTKKYQSVGDDESPLDLTLDFECLNTHIFNGKDFFDYKAPLDVDYIISNPPYSIKYEVFKRLFEFNIPFAMLVGVVGLFESQKRFNLFKDNTFEIMYFNKRISYFQDYSHQNTSLNPPFSSVYLCSNILPTQIVFEVLDKSNHNQIKLF